MKGVTTPIQEILAREFNSGNVLPPGEFEWATLLSVIMSKGDGDTPFKFGVKVIYNKNRKNIVPEWIKEIYILIIDRANELIKDDWCKFILDNRKRDIHIPFKHGINIFITAFFGYGDYLSLLDFEQKLEFYHREATYYAYHL